MESLEHKLWIVQIVNQLLGPLVAGLLGALGFHVEGHEVIPNYMVMIGIIVVLITVFCVIVRSGLSVENPGKLQIVVEDLIGAVKGILTEYIGPTGPQYLPLIGTVGLFIFVSNMIGKIPGFMSPTASLNVTAGCAVTVWVYYHIQGVRAQGLGKYLAHFAMPPGVPVAMAPLMLVIEVISHLSRVLSLSLRLFGNVFGEELVVLIMGSIIPFLVPLPMMVLGVVTGTLQAFIFMLLSVIYLAGAVAAEHHDDEHGEAHAAAH
ncbi:MAG: F0F1 ATP synthase subunit A [Vicinamibacterales bacterium]